MTERPKDPDHWLLRFSAKEWIAAALAEMSKAETAYDENDARGGLAAARRAAGMALNAALVVSPELPWGRTYMDHLAAVAKDDTAPAAVRDGAKLLIETRPPGGDVIGLRSKARDHHVIEAAKDLMAHAYAIVARAGDS